MRRLLKKYPWLAGTAGTLPKTTDAIVAMLRKLPKRAVVTTIRRVETNYG